jgi:hypothetical protein
MTFDLLCSSFLWTSTRAWSNLSRLVWPIPLYLFLPLVFLRLDWVSWCFLRLDALALLLIIKVFLALLDWILRYKLFHGFNTLGSHLREEGSLDYDRGLVRLQVQPNLDTTINRQHIVCHLPPLYTALCNTLVAASPWPIKGGGRRPVAGTWTHKHIHLISLWHHTTLTSSILALASIILAGT